MPGAAPVPGSCSGVVQSRVVGLGVEHEWLLRFLFERVTAVTELAFGQVQAPIGLYGAERTKLTHVAAGCRNIVVTVTKATIVHTGGTSGRGASGDLASHPPASSYDCPAKALIKGNESSMIYHPPDSPSYAQTTPEQCFASEAGARAAGFRKAIYQAASGGGRCPLHAASPRVRGRRPDCV